MLVTLPADVRKLQKKQLKGGGCCGKFVRVVAPRLPTELALSSEGRVRIHLGHTGRIRKG